MAFDMNVYKDKMEKSVANLVGPGFLFIPAMSSSWWMVL